MKVENLVIQAPVEPYIYDVSRPTEQQELLAFNINKNLSTLATQGFVMSQGDDMDKVGLTSWIQGALQVVSDWLPVAIAAAAAGEALPALPAILGLGAATPLVEFIVGELIRVAIEIVADFIRSLFPGGGSPSAGVEAKLEAMTSMIETLKDKLNEDILKVGVNPQSQEPWLSKACALLLGLQYRIDAVNNSLMIYMQGDTPNDSSLKDIRDEIKKIETLLSSVGVMAKIENFDKAMFPNGVVGEGVLQKSFLDKNSLGEVYSLLYLLAKGKLEININKGWEVDSQAYNME